MDLDTSNVFLRKAGLVLCLIASWSAPQHVWAQTEQRTLTTIEAVRSLSAEEANKGYPVELEAVITYCWTLNRPPCFVQDSTGGIFVGRQSTPFEAGTLLKISGKSVQGRFAPDIAGGAEVTVVGKVPLPEPSRKSPHYFFAGKEDATWVEIEGVVRSARVLDAFHKGLELKLDSYGNTVTVRINDTMQPEYLVGAFIRIQGVAAGTYNIERQFNGLLLWVPSIDLLHIINPGYSDTFEDVPLELINNAFSVNLNRSKGHYVRIGGIVTYARSGEKIVIRDETGSVRIEGDSLDQVNLHDSVEVIGFPAFTETRPYIKDAVLMNHGRTDTPPLPVPFDSLSGIRGSSLVSIKAQLNEVLRIDSTIIYTLALDSYRFHAYLNASAEAPMPHPGSLLELTGIIDVLYDQLVEDPPEMDPFELHLRTASDVMVLKQGPWWTASHTRWLSIGLVFIVAMVVSWTVLLRRQIHAQTWTIRRQLKEVEELKENAEQANQAKSTFLASMSHEIRTPLNGVIGFTSLMHGTGLSEEQQDLMKSIQTSSEALLGLINDILDFSKIEAGKIDLEMQPFNLRECLKEALNILSHQANEKGFSMSATVSTSVPETILGDITRLRQILINLLSNAIKFTERGEVSVRVRSKPLGPQNAHRIQFAVKDNGIGISKENLETIFETFTQADASTTRRFGGTGLGLAICKRLSEMMGGSIRAESVEGKGSTFTFDIVTESIEDRVPVQEPDDDAKSGSALKIAVAEKNTINQKILGKFLSQLEYQADVFGTAKAMLSNINWGRYDMVFIDLELTDVDVFVAARKIGSMTKKPPYMIAMSVDHSPEVRAACKEAGIHGFLQKPLKMEELMEVLNSAQAPQTRMMRSS